jgi:hypothetical protein
VKGGVLTACGCGLNYQTLKTVFKKTGNQNGGYGDYDNYGCGGDYG